MLKAAYTSYNLIFKEVAVTSRETMRCKLTYFVKIWDDADPMIYGIGECGLFRGLSCDDKPDYESVLNSACHNIDKLDVDGLDSLREYPSIVFGIETALLDLRNGGIRQLYDTSWSRGEESIIINGLVWMGDKQKMMQRVADKLSAGFKCVKFKIGGIDFDDELDMIQTVRSHFPSKNLEIRLDANGGFNPGDALWKLDRLSRYDIHSIEQPVKPRQWDAMAEICSQSPIPIALDEELIGINDVDGMNRMVESIHPSYLILKPSLCGGMSGADRWIEMANRYDVGWWATSALESNIGLNVISQWVSTKNVSMPQGLGTGALYINNIESPIVQRGQCIEYDTTRQWIIPELKLIG